jgi:hypothetical protein
MKWSWLLFHDKSRKYMGLILVFDMDQTILDSSDPYLFNRPNRPYAYKDPLLRLTIRESLNWNVVNILKRAAALRASGKVSAICMLTNNSSTIMVSAVDDVLREIVGSNGRYKTYSGNSTADTMPDKTYFFDSIMMRQHASRPQVYDPPKRLLDILNMMEYMGIKDKGLDSIKDIFFFDDIGTHNLRAELNFMANGKYSNHYIHITPPYSKNFQDKTHYDSVLKALADLDGKPATLPPVAVKPTTTGPLVVRRTYLPQPIVDPPTLSLNGKNTRRKRSNAKINATNLELPPQARTIHKPVNHNRPSVLSAFSRASIKGGSRANSSRVASSNSKAINKPIRSRRRTIKKKQKTRY